MQANSILPIPLADGIYCGTWKGFHVTIALEGELTQFKVDKALRRYDFPCIILVENKKATIDSGNPLNSQINEWKTKAKKWDSLRATIGEYYLEPGEEGYDKMKDENGLLGIGEDAAQALGYL